MKSKQVSRLMVLAIFSLMFLGCGTNEQVVVPDKVSVLQNTKVEELNFKQNQASQAKIPFEIRQRLDDRAANGRSGT